MQRTELRRKTPLRSRKGLPARSAAKQEAASERPMRQANLTRYSTLAPIGRRGKRLAAGDARARRQARAHAKGICQRCGKAGSDHHHWVRRGIESVRHHRWNQSWFCQECHDFLGANPEYQRDWIRANLPAEQAEWIFHQRKGYRDDRLSD